jgi:(p)ppGpp synthase/HD superfamily hydrolase
MSLLNTNTNDWNPLVWNGEDTRVIKKARDFALAAHGTELHAELPFVQHLGAVTEKLRQVLLTNCMHPQDAEQCMAAGWLHDTVEDTDVTVVKIKALFGPDIGNMVELLSDQPGKNRLERHLMTYFKLRESCSSWLGRKTLMVKLCDRWHNHQRSIDMNQKFAAMYADEYLYFKFALWSPVWMFEKQWIELDEQFEKLKAYARKLPKETLEKYREENNNHVTKADSKIIIDGPYLKLVPTGIQK